FADLDGRVLRRGRRLASQHLTDRPVADRLLKREDGVVRATTWASRLVFDTMARHKLTIAGHVRPTVPQSGWVNRPNHTRSRPLRRLRLANDELPDKRPLTGRASQDVRAKVRRTPFNP